MIHSSNTVAANFLKLIEDVKGHIQADKRAVGDVNTQLSYLDSSSRLNTSTDTLELNYTRNQLDLVSTNYSIFTQKTLSKVDYIISHKTSLNTQTGRSKKTEKESLLSYQTTVEYKEKSTARETLDPKQHTSE